MTEEDFPDALPPGHRLHWYVLERVLGQGGFGITYLAHDTNLDRRVAIKEYLPAEVARRRSDASARPRTESHAERFAWGLERFLSEARTLARFEHPNIVRVLSIFEANNTAYMVMRFEEGEDLGTLLDRRGTLPQTRTDRLPDAGAGGTAADPQLGLHPPRHQARKHLHPRRRQLRCCSTSARRDSRSAAPRRMTILVAPGYAPLEQYYGDAKTQGPVDRHLRPWRDLLSRRRRARAARRDRARQGRARQHARPAGARGRRSRKVATARPLLRRSTMRCS